MGRSYQKRNAERIYFENKNKELIKIQKEIDRLKAGGNAHSGGWGSGRVIGKPGDDIHNRQLKARSRELLSIKNSERYHNYAMKLQTQEANKIQQEIDAGDYKGVSEGDGIVQPAPSDAFPSVYQPTAETLRSQELNAAFSPQAVLTPQPWQIGENLKGLNINFDYNADKAQNPAFYTDAPAGQELSPAYMDQLNKMSEAASGIDYPTGGGDDTAVSEPSGDTATTTTTKQSSRNEGHKNYDVASTATGSGALSIQKRLLDAGFKQSELNRLQEAHRKKYGKRKGLLSIFKKGG